MRILIAPDKFKGALSARKVAENIAKGLLDVLPEAKIDIMPMADGGEGTAEVISDALGGVWTSCAAHDPIGREIEARYAWIADRRLAVMEMSEAAGMRGLQKSECDVAGPGEAGQLLQQKSTADRKKANRRSWATQLIDSIGCPPGALRVDCANTFGVGEMLLDAAKRGAAQIIIGLGGSATNDGGFGMARALGFQFFAGAKEFKGPIRELANLTRISRPSPVALRLPLPEGEEKGEGKPLLVPKIIAAADVRNPLLGENGATRVFGPQKGVPADQIESFDRALARFAEVIVTEFHVDHRNEPGAGAAGGLGFGLMSFCGGKIKPGFDVVAEVAALESKMRDVDVVITGEGSLDRQTLEGKTPAGVARLARKLQKRVFALVGRATEDREVKALFDGVYQNAQSNMSETENMARAGELLQINAGRLAKEL